MSSKMLAPTRLTEAQAKWVEEEGKRTGDSLASVIRKLIQEKVEKKK